MGKNRFRVLKYEMVRGTHEIRQHQSSVYIEGFSITLWASAHAVLYTASHAKVGIYLHRL